jgi:xanthine dehydrogenase YagR molybdenum-binding subunit
MNKHGLIGKPVSRIDGPLKVQGKARFAAEVSLPGLAYASLLYSTIARGRIATLETVEAEAAPGVALVMTYRNAPRMVPPPLMMSAPKAAGASGLPIMQDAEIRWNGQPVALVLAKRKNRRTMLYR